MENSSDKSKNLCDLLTNPDNAISENKELPEGFIAIENKLLESLGIETTESNITQGEFYNLLIKNKDTNKEYLLRNLEIVGGDKKVEVPSNAYNNIKSSIGDMKELEVYIDQSSDN